MTLLDELHMELIHAADFRMYDTKGVMLPGVPYRIGVPMAAVRAENHPERPFEGIPRGSARPGEGSSA